MGHTNALLPEGLDHGRQGRDPPDGEKTGEARPVALLFLFNLADTAGIR
jgi:hypothetical protein